MTEIILDERTWCENVLKSFSMGSSPAGTLNRLAKYYFTLGHKKNDIARLLEEFILRCNPSANIMRWQEVIDNCVRHADRRPLIAVESIPITQKELDLIGALPGQMIRKLMFTLLCLAKYRNAVSPKNDSWVSYENRDIFKMANIQTTRVRQYTMMNDLLQVGYVGMSKIVDNVSVRVMIIDNDVPVMHISDFRNIGHQYSAISSDNYLECANCGLMVRRSGNNQKYCHACANHIRLMRASYGSTAA